MPHNFYFDDDNNCAHCHRPTNIYYKDDFCNHIYFPEYCKECKRLVDIKISKELNKKLMEMFNI